MLSKGNTSQRASTRMALAPVTLLASMIFMGMTLLANGLSAPAAPSKPSTLVVFGDQYKFLPLLVGKIAAKRGIQTYCICGKDTEKNCRRLMYGEEYAKAGTDDDDKAKPISSPDDMQTVLQQADCMIFVGNEDPLDSTSVQTLINIASERDEEDTKEEDFVPLSNVVMLSKMGATKKGGGGFFGGGGGDAKILESEKFLQEKAKAKDLGFGIVRAGVVLKGGGPGDGDPETGMLSTNDFGLDRFFYTKLLDVVEASVAMAHDRYTLGADVSAGDKYATESVPNMIQIMGSKSSFEEIPYESNRVVAAEAAVAALYHLYDNPGSSTLDFSVGTAKARAPPTPEEWSDLLKNL